MVTSYAEVWIEINTKEQVDADSLVTSYAEVWIEIILYIRKKTTGDKSPPTRRCGLK